MKAQFGSRTIRILEPTVRECADCRGVGEVRVCDDRSHDDTWAVCSACNGSGERWS